MLRLWDLRQATPPASKAKKIAKEASDLTGCHVCHRSDHRRGRAARDLASIVSGTGPTYGLLFGLGTPVCTPTLYLRSFPCHQREHSSIQI